MRLSRKVRKAIIKSLDTEFQRIFVDKVRNDVAEALVTLYSTTDLSVFFTPRELETLKDTVFNNINFRDFVLQATARFSFMMEYYNVAETDLANIIINSASRTSTSSDAQESLINDITKGALVVYEENVHEIVSHNLWIVFLYLFVIFFPGSGVHNYLFIDKKI
jgi:hypothetical protein